MVDFGGFLSEVKVAAESDAYRSEAELRQEFLAKLGALFSERGWQDVKVRIEESLAQGRSDARISYMVFEFKSPGELGQTRKREASLAETTTNLMKTAEKLRIEKSKLRGLLTDGRVAQILAWHSPSGEFAAVDLGESPLRDRLAFRPLTEIAPWLEGAIHVLTTRELSPENLLEDFGPGSDLGMQLFSELWKTFQSSKTEPRPKSFFEQWQLLFSSSTRNVVSGDDLRDRIRSYGIEAAEVRSENDVREFLFVLHTHYAIILKFIALLVADTIELLGPVSLLDRVRSNPSVQWAQAEEQLPSLAANLIERDVFSWFRLPANRELAALMGLVAERFRHYDAGSVRRDVLKRVYQQIIPPKLRKALGEFYTPDWAADLTLDEVGYSGMGRVLDPSCGSGTFLVLAIRRSLEAAPDSDPKSKLAKILDSVIGFDLNPVAVSTSRINYLLAVVELLKKARPAQGISIPVFLCDSIVVPTERVLDPVAPTAVVTTCLKDLVVPFEDKFPQKTTRMLRILGSHADRSTEAFLDAVRSELGVTYEENYRNLLRDLHRFISDLQSRGANGIWANFIENFFAPLFVGRFDYIVGNPPWVAPVHVPEDYRKRVISLTERSGYLEVYDPKLRRSNARHGAPGYVACLPFVYVAMSRYLKASEDSRIAFLLTKSLVTSMNAGGWRREVLDRLQAVTDLSPITDIHEDANCWAFIPVFGSRKSSAPLPYRFCHRRQARPRGEKPEAQPPLAFNNWKLRKSLLPFDSADACSPWLIGPPEVLELFRRMCDGQSRLGDVFDLNMGLKTENNDTFFVDKITDVKDGRAHVITAGGEHSVIEEDLLFPLLVGENIDSWACGFKWIILPYDKNWQPVSETELSKDFPDAYDHFHRHERRLRSRAHYKPGTPLWSVFDLSPTKVKNAKVAFPLIELLLKASPAPAVLEVPPVSNAKPVLVDHSAYFVNTTSPQASRYVSALLNSSPYRALAYALAMPKGGFPYKQYVQWNVAVLPCISMEKEQGLTRKISNAVESARKVSRLGSPEFALQVDALVGELFGFGEDESRLIRRFLDFSIGKISLWPESHLEDTLSPPKSHSTQRHRQAG